MFQVAMAPLYLSPSEVFGLRHVAVPAVVLVLTLWVLKEVLLSLENGKRARRRSTRSRKVCR